MKLFHCVVVMGAAIGAGCGGQTAPVASSSRDGRPDGGTGDPSGRDAAPTGGDGGGADSGCFPEASPSTFGFGVVGCTYQGSCAGSPEEALGPQACAHPQQLACGRPPGLSTPHGCACDTTAPLVPTDCPQTAQFSCDDWSQPCGCRCDPGAPTVSSMCTPPSPEAAPPWTCHSYDPPVGCSCFVVPPPIL